MNKGKKTTAVAYAVLALIIALFVALFLDKRWFLKEKRIYYFSIFLSLIVDIILA